MSDLRETVIARESSKTGLRGKVNAKCCECIYDPKGSGTWRQQVSNCTSWACPLYDVRPLPEQSDKGE